MKRRAAIEGIASYRADAVRYGDRLQSVVALKSARCDGGYLVSVARLIFSLAKKGIISIEDNGVRLCPDIDALTDVFKNEPTTVVITPTASSNTQLCCTCVGGKVACCSRSANRAGCFRVCMVTPQRVVEYITNNGYLDDIPAAVTSSELIMSDEDERNVDSILTLEQIPPDGSISTWTVYYSHSDCLLEEPGGAVNRCDRKQAEELIFGLIKS